jgi:hypothetical protein
MGPAHVSTIYWLTDPFYYMLSLSLSILSRLACSQGRELATDSR